MAISFCVIMFQRYGWDIISGKAVMRVTEMTDTIMSTTANKIIGALFPVGMFLFLFGVISLVDKAFRRGGGSAHRNRL